MAHATRLVAKDLRRLRTPKLDGGRSLDRALSERRSIRDYADAPLTLAALSQLLWAAQGITGAGDLRTAPSAGALYPLETCVVAGDVEGLPGAIYRYRPAGHALELVVEGDKRAELSEAAFGQECVARAPIVIALAAVHNRTTGKYGERGHRYVHMEVGHAAQNVCLEATALDLGAVVVGAFDDPSVKAVLHLTRGEEPVCLLPVGRPR